MEEIYPPNTYGASEHFPLKEYFEEFSKAFVGISNIQQDESEEDPETQSLQKVKGLMGVDMSPTEFKNLSEACRWKTEKTIWEKLKLWISSIDLLTCEGENIKDFPTTLPENINSSTKFPAPFIISGSDNLNVNKCYEDLEKKKDPSQLCVGNKRQYHQSLEVH